MNTQYKADLASNSLDEVAKYEKPNLGCSITDDECNRMQREKTRNYEQHLSSLRHYTLVGEGWEERLYNEDEFEVLDMPTAYQRGIQLSSGFTGGYVAVLKKIGNRYIGETYNASEELVIESQAWAKKYCAGQWDEMTLAITAFVAGRLNTPVARLKKQQGERMFTEAQMKEMARIAWMSAANAYRMYPNNKHTFVAFWSDLGESEMKNPTL